MKGSEFIAQVRALSASDRERRVIELVRAGDYMQWPMRTIINDEGGRAVSLSVASDYFAIGEPGDLVRVPLSAPAAQAIADILGMRLPTPKIIDLIWRAADIHLEPQPMSDVEGFPYDSSMCSVERFALHNEWIEQGRTSRFGKTYQGLRGRYGLVAGHKKDVVITNRLLERGGGGPAIAGWHKLSGVWTQPLSLAHRATTYYSDYSHGVRFISPDMSVGGRPARFEMIASDPFLAEAISYESPLRVTRYDTVAPFNPPSPQLRPEGVLGGGGGPLKFVRAVNYTPVPRSAPRHVWWVVLHSMENPERPDGAENCAAWFGGLRAPKASAHYCCDQDSIVQCVKESDVAWAAPGANRRGVHVELNGYARQVASEWDDPASRSMLDLVAVLVSDICARHSLPIEFVDASGLVAGRMGITTHAEVTKAIKIAEERGLTRSEFFGKKTDHTDPGRGFPMGEFLSRVRAAR